MGEARLHLPGEPLSPLPLLLEMLGLNVKLTESWPTQNLDTPRPRSRSRAPSSSWQTPSRRFQLERRIAKQGAKTSTKDLLSKGTAEYNKLCTIKSLIQVVSAESKLPEPLSMEGYSNASVVPVDEHAEQREAVQPPELEEDLWLVVAEVALKNAEPDEKYMSVPVLEPSKEEPPSETAQRKLRSRKRALEGAPKASPKAKASTEASAKASAKPKASNAKPREKKVKDEVERKLHSALRLNDSL